MYICNTEKIKKSFINNVQFYLKFNKNRFKIKYYYYPFPDIFPNLIDLYQNMYFWFFPRKNT